MALQKQPIPLNFAQGLDTKSDPKQVQLGKFLAMNNSIFDKAGKLSKRFGFNTVTALPNALQTTITTLNDNLIATGSSLYAFSQDTNQWLNQGQVQPINLSTLPLVRVSTSQTSPDMAVAASGLTCLVYVDNSVAYYQVSDSTTGQQIVQRTAIASGATNPRAFLLGSFFIVTYMLASSFRCLAIPTAVPTSTPTPIILSSSVSGASAGYDGIVFADTLFFSWAGSAGDIKTGYLSTSLTVSAPATIASHTATSLSITADTVNNVIYTTFSDGTDIYTAAYSQLLVPILSVTHVATVGITKLTSIVISSVLQIYYEVTNTYAYNSIPTDYIRSITVTVAGSVGSPTTLLRSVGLASKAFTAANGTTYMLVAFAEQQPTYYLMDSTGKVYMRLAYSNGGGYASSQVLPNVTLLGSNYMVPYLANDFLASTNKGTNTGLPSAAIYTQTGVNLASFTISSTGQYSSEIASSLHLTGGQLWQYDGVKPVEHNFQYWPSAVGASTATGSGSIAAGTYYYQFCYEWTDNAGNLHRSAPSVPVSQVTTTASSTNTLKVPTLRITEKLSPNPVRIVGYRWSLAQQVYYQFTSLTSPVLNDTSVDYVTITDTLADSSIIGNVIIYTTGGVVENIAAPASVHSTLFKSRLFLIDAEDRNLLWFSKQVIETVPVEMSDLFTIYVAPTTGAQGSTGPMTALAAMDDKLIIFKKDALYYVTGTGPDNAGGNNDFSDPIFIASSVGCANPASIVLTPSGLMFQSDKGIWLLGRDLQTQYIGAPVEEFNSQVVMSAQCIPGTNQVRFVLDNNQTLMYDYFFNQWGTHSNKFAISSTLNKGLQTYLNKDGQVYQETPGRYLDGSEPVLMSFTTSWINIAGLQGLERFYSMNLLGSYYSPFKLQVQLAYNYNPDPLQSVMVTPDNYAAPWGGEAQWGSGAPWGGSSDGKVFTARVFPDVQKCQSFQVIINELFDASYNTQPGQGFDLSGLLLLVGVKRGSRTQTAAKSFGGY